MNAAETLLVNSPVRAAVQRTYEARLLERLGGRLTGGRALEVGCGRGVGTEIILDRFGADEVVALDVDPAMLRRARHRLRDRGHRVSLAVGDAADLAYASDSFDAVFDFWIIHHVPDWRRAVAEIARVLRPGGRFYFSEVTRHALDRATYRRLFDHPEQDRFSGVEFVDALEDHQIQVGNRFMHRMFGDFVLGVGMRR